LRRSQSIQSSGPHSGWGMLAECMSAEIARPWARAWVGAAGASDPASDSNRAQSDSDIVTRSARLVHSSGSGGCKGRSPRVWSGCRLRPMLSRCTVSYPQFASRHNASEKETLTHTYVCVNRLFEEESRFSIVCARGSPLERFLTRTSCGR
jgi:hypothetical protein